MIDIIPFHIYYTRILWSQISSFIVFHAPQQSMVSGGCFFFGFFLLGFHHPFPPCFFSWAHSKLLQNSQRSRWLSVSAFEDEDLGKKAKDGNGFDRLEDEVLRV